MKKLILLFRKSLSIKLFSLIFFILLACTAGYQDWVFFSEDQTLPNAAEVSHSSNTLLSQQQKTLTDQYLLEPFTDSEFSCSKTPASLELKFSMRFDSSSPPHIVSARTLWGEGKNIATGFHLAIDSTKFFLPFPRQELKDIKSELCSNTGKTSINSSEPIKNIASKIFPNCKIEKHNSGPLACRIRTKPLQELDRFLVNLKKTVLRSWQRQPYLFLRRLSVTKQLLQILSTAPTSESLDRFCSLLKISDKKELPLTFSLHTWQSKACQNPLEDRIFWAKIGVDHASKELTFLKEILKKTNKTGQLQVKIPRIEKSYSTLLVRLQPSQDVLEHVHQTAIKLQTNGPNSSKNNFYSGACWHPIYQSSNLHLASLMLLQNEENKNQAQCLPELTLNSDDISKYESVYLYESILGETSFIIGNGRYKILQLPTGTYDYEIINLPENTARWKVEEATDRSYGSFTWAKKRPRPSIKQWL